MSIGLFHRIFEALPQAVLALVFLNVAPSGTSPLIPVLSCILSMLTLMAISCRKLIMSVGADGKTEVKSAFKTAVKDLKPQVASTLFGEPASKSKRASERVCESTLFGEPASKSKRASERVSERDEKPHHIRVQ
jgi:hypothetical protein